MSESSDLSDKSDLDRYGVWCPKCGVEVSKISVEGIQNDYKTGKHCAQRLSNDSEWLSKSENEKTK